jgi:HEAT repeat protein
MKQILLHIILALVPCFIPALAAQIQSNNESIKTIDELMKRFVSVEHHWQQRDVARELVALGDGTIIPEIEKYLKTRERRRRCNAALVIAGLGDRRGVAIIIGELKDRKPRPTSLIGSDGKPYHERQIVVDRGYAAFLLGQLRDKDAVPALVEATKDISICYQAAISLGQIGDKSAIPALLKIVEHFPEERLCAGHGLAALGRPEGFDILIGIIDASPRWVERRNAVSALGMIGNSVALPTVIKALKDNHVNVRVSAARALGEIGNSTALPALIEAMDDTEVTKIHAPTTVGKEARKAIEAIKRR